MTPYDQPPTVPGPLLLLLILIVVGGFGFYMWLADMDARDAVRRERYRRDQEAQEEWERAKKAMAPRWQRDR